MTFIIKSNGINLDYMGLLDKICGIWERKTGDSLTGELI
jgi:hypothetical protein